MPNQNQPKNPSLAVTSTQDKARSYFESNRDFIDTP